MKYTVKEVMMMVGLDSGQGIITIDEARELLEFPPLNEPELVPEIIGILYNSSKIYDNPPAPPPGEGWREGVPTKTLSNKIWYSVIREGEEHWSQPEELPPDDGD